MSQYPSLKIAIVGVGGIGSAFAYQFSKVGKHEVTVVARPNSKRLEELERDKGIKNKNGETATVIVAAGLDPTIAYDLVVVTLKHHQVDAVLPALRASAAKKIQFMFNNFEPERLLTEIGASRCVFGMPFIQASIDANGFLRASIGAGGQKCLMDQAHSVELFKASGLPAAIETEMLLWLKCHVPMCIAFESISVAGVRRGHGAAWNEAIVVAKGVKESFRLIRYLGYKIYPASKVWINRAPTWVLAGLFWFISRIKSFRELLASGIEECRDLIAVLVKNAASAKTVDVKKIEAMEPVAKES